MSSQITNESRLEKCQERMVGGLEKCQERMVGGLVPVSKGGGARCRCIKKCLESDEWIPFTRKLMRLLTEFGRKHRGDGQLVFVFFCRSGRHRSVAAAELLARYWRTE